MEASAAALAKNAGGMNKGRVMQMQRKEGIMSYSVRREDELVMDGSGR